MLDFLAGSLSETMFKFTNLVMRMRRRLACLGSVAYTIGHLGLGVMLPLLKLLGTMYAALLFCGVRVVSDCADGADSHQAISARGAPSR